ncbi:MAG: primosomal protein N' [Chloroflexota bacterium]|nr:primosomal protein N' [Chloroflexota bacterium]
MNTSPPQYAQVLIFLPVHSKETPFFDYEIPARLQYQIQPGMLVAVPFREQLLPALVITLAAVPSVPRTRPIQELLQPEPVLRPELLALARWMARETLAPLHECVKLMLPPGMKPESLATSAPPKSKTVRLAALALPRTAWDEKLTGLQRLDLYRVILTFLEQEAEPVEVSVIYATTGSQNRHLKMLARRGLLTFQQQKKLRDPLSEAYYTPEATPDLIPDQQAVWDEVAALLTSVTTAQPPPPVLLLGVTGSGKTEIYLRATEQVLSQGRQALMLVPEISLTPQTVRRFMVRFPGKVGLWHSGMTVGERFDTWQRIREGELTVVVGARSALFAPFPQLGLIVMDEEEESSYKSLRRPYYHTRETAEELARQTGALLIMGSATPSLEAHARALQGRYRLLQLPRRILSQRQQLESWQEQLHLSASHYHALPPIQIVDLRAELKTGNRSIFSRPLQQAVDRALAQKEQIILFLNRRGTSTHIFCRDCGWVAQCPRCEIPLTHHRSLGSLCCHRCNHREPMVSHCPQCGSQWVRAFGLGTEGLVERAGKRWPDAKLMRWDHDVARNHKAHRSLMAQFAAGKADILIGTQMIARGLDLPAVTVVGVISADVGLHLPDFRAAERTFQLLMQVAGRAGRGIKGGQAILQTYHPDNYAIQYAAAHDYAGFVQHESEFRRRAGYPPTIRLARLLTRDRDPHQAQAQAEALAARLKVALQMAGLPSSDLIGPAPAFFARVRGYTRWHLILRHVDPAAFLRRITIPPGWRVDIDPVNML